MGKRGVVGNDVDAELIAYFNGGYAAELGLRSSTGAQLERLEARMGASSMQTPDGLNHHVKLGVVGVDGLLEVGRVELALRRIALVPKGEQHVTVLKAYYNKRAVGFYDGLEDYGEFVVVAAHTQTVLRATTEWLRKELTKEVAANGVAIADSRKGRDDELATLHGRRRVLLATKPTEHAWHRPEKEKPRRCRNCGAKEPCKAACWKREVKNIGHVVDNMLLLIKRAEPDTAAAIRTKWAAPTEAHRLAILRATAKAARGPKDSPGRREAKLAQAAALDEARGLWRAARTAYAAERGIVDRDIAEAMRRAHRAPDDAFLAELDAIPADQD